MFKNHKMNVSHLSTTSKIRNMDFSLKERNSKLILEEAEEWTKLKLIQAHFIKKDLKDRE